MMRTTKLFVLAASATLLTTSLQAQTTNCDESTTSKTDFNATSCNVTTPITALVPYLAQIIKGSNAVALPQATVAFMNAQMSSIVAGQNLEFRSNFAYQVVATAAFGGTTPWSKPAADLKLSLDGFAADDRDFSTGRVVSSGVPTATTSISPSFRVKYAWANDLPGNYQATVTYTLTAQ